MTLFNKIAFIALFTFVVQFSTAQQNLLDFENSLKFARYLSTSHQLNFAAQEYERLHFLWPDDSTVILELVQTYRLNQQCGKLNAALNLFSNNDRLIKNTVFTKEYLNFCLICKTADQNYFGLLPHLKPDEQVFYKTSYYWVNKQYDLLLNYSPVENEILAKSNPDLHNITNAFARQKYKSPFLASLMSTVLPGSGKAYVNRWGDAFISFLFVGTNSYASYRAFKKKGVNSVNGWIFGSIAFSFYSANIYGSAKAVKNYNNRKKETLQFNAENIIYNSF